MSLIVAGDRSGVGKTTVTLALLAALTRRKLSVQSFKVGPDYIDPMFHRHVTGRFCRNLDPVLTSEKYVQDCFARHSRTVQYALIEGVMGLFDGAAGRDDFASTAHVARLLNLPVMLVLDCSRMSHSIAAIVRGFQSFDPRLQFAGVVLNRVGSDRHLDLLKSALEPLKIPIFGVLRRHDHIQIPDRHLGLVPTDELPGLNDVVDRLAELGETCFDWTKLMRMLATDDETDETDETDRELETPLVRIAVAQDPAFNFYYSDNLDALKEQGAELVPWSPLNDLDLPEDVHGFYFGGGFPEMFAQALSDNVSARKAVYQAIQSGMPTYAECGGLMYLCEKLTDFSGDRVSMVGVLPTDVVMGDRLTLGYRQATALQDSPIVAHGLIVHGHEFHRSHLTSISDTPLFTLSSPLTPHSSLPEGWHLPNLHASYLHLHWGATPEIPKRFIQHCTNFRRGRYP
jgi:cobyrinic acid a,c-diamide synthase